MSDQPQPKLVIGDIDLTAVVAAPAPFATLLLSPGPQAKERTQVALDRVPVPSPFAQLILDTVPGETHTSHVVIASQDRDVFTHKIDEPFRRDTVRFGSVPALGSILESSQMVSSHLVITLDDDVFAVTSFGHADIEDIKVFEARDAAVEYVSVVTPPMVALVGSTHAIDEMRAELGRKIPLLSVNGYPTDEIDTDLETISDRILVDATTLAAEDVTRKLGTFRASRDAGQTVEGLDTLGALESGIVLEVLVHDDDSAEPANGVRACDEVIATAIRLGVPVTMIPGVPVERGPQDGIGAILDLDHATAAATTVASTDANSQGIEQPMT